MGKKTGSKPSGKSGKKAARKKTHKGRVRQMNARKEQRKRLAERQGSDTDLIGLAKLPSALNGAFESMPTLKLSGTLPQLKLENEPQTRPRLSGPTLSMGLSVTPTKPQSFG